MPSHLRLQADLEASSTAGRFITKPASPPAKRQKMSISQTYVLAHTARSKLSRAAARPDHDLRLLVGHANLLDGLMLELADAEREQEAWFAGAVSKASEPERHVQWADSSVEEEADWEAGSDSSDEEEDDEDEVFNAAIAPRRFQSTLTQIDDDDEEFEDDEQDISDLALHRTHSHSPPELLEDEDSSSSEDENTPPSPPSQTLSFSEKEQQAIVTTTKQSLSPESSQAFFEEGYYLPQRAAISAF